MWRVGSPRGVWTLVGQVRLDGVLAILLKSFAILLKSLAILLKSLSLAPLT